MIKNYYFNFFKNSITKNDLKSKMEQVQFDYNMNHNQVPDSFAIEGRSLWMIYYYC